MKKCKYSKAIAMPTGTLADYQINLHLSFPRSSITGQVASNNGLRSIYVSKQRLTNNSTGKNA